MKKGISQILKEAALASTPAEKAEVLRKNQSIILFDVFRLVFDDGYTWKLKKKSYDYTPFGGFDAQGALYYNMKKVPRYFLEDATTVLEEKRLELLWIQFLESIDAEDAKLMESIRSKKKLNVNTITRKVVDLAFPGLLKGSE